MHSADLIHGDRRADRRYAFELPLRFFYQSAGAQCAGSGHTMDFCRKGVRFASEDAPAPGADVELRIEWPFLLQDVCPLELRVWGRALRSDDRGTVIRMNKYEFRTCGARSFDQVSAGAANWSIVA
jgi:hypothetical protein